MESLTKNKVFPGTAIKIKIRIPDDFTNTAFKDMLKEIADLGEKESRGIRGAIKEASSKSKGQYNEDFSGVCDIVKVHI